jgi:Protein of unknown function (DUF3072)
MAPSETPKATSRQLAYLRALANKTGTTFTYPATKAQASREIKRLKQISSTGMTSAEHEAEDHARELHNDLPLTYGAAIRDHEIEGYGSTARWSSRP